MKSTHSAAVTTNVSNKTIQLRLFRSLRTITISPRSHTPKWEEGGGRGRGTVRFIDMPETEEGAFRVSHQGNDGI